MSGNEIIRLMLQGGTLMLVFLGAGLYLRGFWVYFRAVRWLHGEPQREIRRRYRRSAIAALLREPALVDAKRQCMLAILGLPLVAVGGTLFNALQGLAVK